MLKPIEKSIKFVKNSSTKGKSFPITHVSAVIDDNGESIKSTIDSLKNKGSLTKVTWLELKNKRDTGKLIPGSLYRITDYNCTTTQENTRSAGHQFDIVLLALSENKLAEEGWAMEHPTDVYDVTFTDGVKKCYLYLTGEEDGYLVDCETLLGNGVNTSDFDEFDADAKTITIDGLSEILNTPDLTYNYFQNSNLSAWKVWYCLDNDTARFAWADDSVDEGSPASITVESNGSTNIQSGTYLRSPDNDAEGFLVIATKAWTLSTDNTKIIYTKTETPSSTTTLYSSPRADDIKARVASYTPPTQGTGLPNGRGVIYRLVDEWNNDVPYDFKNIQFYNNTDYLYAISDINALEEDPTLDGIRVKAIHLLSNINNEVGVIATGNLSRSPLINVIFINNGFVANDIGDNTIARDGENLFT